jgi:hypothetical protein
MNWRRFMVAASLTLLLAANIFLISTENLVVTTKEEVVAQLDPLRLLIFQPETRQENIRELGASRLDGFDRALSSALSQSDQIMASLSNLVANGGDEADLVQRGLCDDSGLPVRYAAIQYLVSESREVVRLRDLSFESQPGFNGAMLLDMHQRFELLPPEREMPTLMVLAAYLSGHGAAALSGEGGWSRAEWSLERVFSDNADLESKVARYLALMLVTLETANEGGGVCSR